MVELAIFLDELWKYSFPLTIIYVLQTNIHALLEL